MASRLAARAFARRGGAWWRPRRGLASYDASPRTYGEAPSSGTPEAFAASSVAQRVVLPDVCDHLRAHGYAVVEMWEHDFKLAEKYEGELLRLLRRRKLASKA